MTSITVCATPGGENLWITKHTNKLCKSAEPVSSGGLSSGGQNVSTHTTVEAWEGGGLNGLHPVLILRMLEKSESLKELVL